MVNSSIGTGKVFVFCGTSGSGRKTISKQLARQLDLVSVVSVTTRAPRPHEIDGKDYHFMTRQAFIEADIRGEFFQTAEIDNHFYGLKKEDIHAALKTNASIYVVVNRYAATRFKYEFGERAIRLFIYVSKSVIKERLQTRGISEEIIEHYMNHYIEEVSYRKECEHIFENVDLTHTTLAVKEAVLGYLPAKTV
ncbi:Guanylate kinase [compost metagenome]